MIGFVPFAILLVQSVVAIEDYCSLNNYPSSGPRMEFTKEASFEEFAILGKFKGLHCCAKGYRSIEWYKDDILYPWAKGISQLILYPESANQTIYTQSVTEDDAGNYTCVLRNDTGFRAHTIHLTVFERAPDDPKVTYISQNKDVAVGEDIRLFCEAFAGRVDLPDAHNEAVWRKADFNGTMPNDPRIHQKKNTREDEQTYGTYLIIENVKKEDFGEYICQISKPGISIEKSVLIQEKIQMEYINPNPVPVSKLIMVFSIIMCCILVFMLLYIRFGLSVQVRLKDSFGPTEDADGKTCDVVIFYAEKDLKMALEVLLPTLENHYNYKCASRQMPSNINLWFNDLQGPASKSRRIVTILSPAALNNNWEHDQVMLAFKQLKALGPQMCCITLKELPTKENEVKDSNGDTLASLKKSLNVLLWDRSNDDKFWLSLRLRLPPMRHRLNDHPSGTQGNNSSRLTNDSQESLDNLV